MIEYHDPMGEPSVAPRPYELRVAASPFRLGLLANGFFDSVKFLDLVAEEMGALVPLAEVSRWNKVNFAFVASDEMLDEIQESCDGVLMAFGH